jgi:hypothetical protein
METYLVVGKSGNGGNFVMHIQAKSRKEAAREALREIHNISRVLHHVHYVFTPAQMRDAKI